jgi:hypothetical protein
MADRAYVLGLIVAAVIGTSACTTGTTPGCGDAADMCGPIGEAGPLPDVTVDAPSGVGADAGTDSPAAVDAPDDSPPPVDAPQDAPAG